MAYNTFNINNIKSELTYGGARQTLFSVYIKNPINTVADEKTQFLVRASSIPESRLGNIAVPFFGRKINLAGDRVFPEWNVTVINDEDFLIRNAMETWSNAINSLESNLRKTPTASPRLYKSDAIVIQYGKTGNILREYKFNGIYPADISPIDLDWEATDRIEEFRVTFMYDSWEVVGQTGQAGGV
jgi:hypothetical protein